MISLICRVTFAKKTILFLPEAHSALKSPLSIFPFFFELPKYPWNYEEESQAQPFSMCWMPPVTNNLIL
jgi:hypothetical protein